MIIYLENQLALYALKLLPIMLYRADVSCISIVGVIFYAIANVNIILWRNVVIKFSLQSDTMSACYLVSY